VGKAASAIGHLNAALGGLQNARRAAEKMQHPDIVRELDKVKSELDAAKRDVEYIKKELN
jgi:hypothetical protein